MIAKVTSAVKYKGKIHLTGQEIEFDKKDKDLLINNINGDSIKETENDKVNKPDNNPEEDEYTEEDLKKMDLDEIKKIADKLEINYAANIGKDTLIAKLIDSAGE